MNTASNATGVAQYVLITAAYNEERYIKRTIESIVAQTVPPLRYVIVSDGSTDRTDEIVQEYACRYPFIQLYRITEEHPRNFPAQAHAIRAGCKEFESLQYDFFGNLDADVAVPPAYFETLLKRFEADPSLGLAGGFVQEECGGEFRDRPENNPRSVPLAVQFFRRHCFEAIGGYVPMKYGGADWVAELRVRQAGWEVGSYPDLPVHHYRPTNGAEGDLRRSRWREGKMDHSVGTIPLFEIVKCLRRVQQRPLLLGAATRLLAYGHSCIRREPRLVPDDLVHYVQEEQWGRIRSLLRRSG